MSNHDPVSHPAHYTRGKIEVIDFIEDKELNFHRANAVKYIVRAGHKDPLKEIEDLSKASWYIEREIARLRRLDTESAQMADSEEVEDDGFRTMVFTTSATMEGISSYIKHNQSAQGTEL